MTDSHAERSRGISSLGRRAVGWITLLEKIAAVGLLVVVLGVTFIQVVARFVFDSPFTWTDELARYSYVWLTFIAAAAVMSQRGHITVEIGDSKIPRLLRTGLNIIGMAAVVVACAMLAAGSLDFLEHRVDGSSTALGVPMAAFYGVVCAGLVLIGIHALINIFILISEAMSGEDETSQAGAATRMEEGI